MLCGEGAISTAQERIRRASAAEAHFERVPYVSRSQDKTREGHVLMKDPKCDGTGIV